MMYFAYGSNLNIDQMNYRCPDSRYIMNGVLPGHRLVFRGPLDIQRQNRKVTHGAIFQISKRDLRALDHYEGYPKCYTRQIMSIQMDKDAYIDCWVYQMTNRTVEKRDGRMPSDRYMETVIDGALELDIPLDPIMEAYQQTKRRCFLDLNISFKFVTA